ncbi:unnamed protein product [Toxocara canis]|uniref:MADF domain-containing protein n=1 Tax=Toxocara canis TaxID=6265 RepID=A0A183VAB1_TOXCA|nr:unnamed protein product [Toxocara canis]
MNGESRTFTHVSYIDEPLRVRITHFDCVFVQTTSICALGSIRAVDRTMLLVDESTRNSSSDRYMKDRSNFRIAKKKPHLTHPTALPFNDSTAADDGRKMSVDSVFNEYLIREVERNPLIYDYGHENYTNAQMKQQVWEHIADALMASVDAVKVRWKTLRDRYQRERRRLATEKARGRFVHSPFALFHAMHFLNKFIGDAPRM